MRLIWGRDADVGAWVAAHVPETAIDFGPSVAAGVQAEDGRPLAGVVFHNYLPRYGSIEISCASVTPRWLTRPIIRQIMAYPFEQLGCGRVTSIAAKRNRDCRQFLEHFGFKREGLVRKGFGSDDAVLYGLLKREWLDSRWAAKVSAALTRPRVALHSIPTEATPL